MGFHPVLAFLDNTNEARAGILRPGKAGANTAADHSQITNLALAQIPDSERYGQPILIRTDGAGATKAWLQHLRSLRIERGVDLDYSVGFTMTDAVQSAILALPEYAGPQRCRSTADCGTARTSPNSPGSCRRTASTSQRTGGPPGSG